MVDYGKAKVYKLVNKGGDELGDMYVGSTCETLSKRLKGHRAAARMGRPAPVYHWIRDIGPENVQIIWIADIPCQNSEQKRAKEQEYIDELKPSLNRRRAYLTREERLAGLRVCVRAHYAANREKILAKQLAQQRAAGVKPRFVYNTEEDRVAARKASQAAGRKRNKEKNAQYQKNWYESNKEYARQWAKDYRERNKEQLALKRMLKRQAIQSGRTQEPSEKNS